MQSAKKYQGKIRKPSSVINVKKQKKTIEQETLEISSRKLEIPREHFMLMKCSLSVVSDSLQLHGLQSTRLLRPWDFPGKSTGVGCYRLLQYFSRLKYSLLCFFWFLFFESQSIISIRGFFLKENKILLQKYAVKIDNNNFFLKISCGYMAKPIQYCKVKK